MNIFKLKTAHILPYLKQCPIHSVRNEKELPTAIQMMVDENPQILKTIPMSEVVPDLTNKSDIAEIEKYLF
jgi:glucose-1-phosphate adenylyltransferase